MCLFLTLAEMQNVCQSHAAIKKLKYIKWNKMPSKLTVPSPLVLPLYLFFSLSWLTLPSRSSVGNCLFFIFSLSFLFPSFGRRNRQPEGAQPALCTMFFDVAVSFHIYTHTPYLSFTVCFPYVPSLLSITPPSSMLHFCISYIAFIAFSSSSFKLLNSMVATYRVHNSVVTTFAHAFIGVIYLKTVCVYVCAQL